MRATKETREKLKYKHKQKGFQYSVITADPV